VLLLPAVRSSSQPRMSLLVTLALATLGASCKRSTPHPDGGADGRGPEDAGVPDTRRPVVEGPDAAPVAADTASPPDAASPDVAVDAGSPDAPVDASTTNPSRLWFHGPEGDFQLSDMEPETPF
jgi:hypothetical protein